MVLDEDVLKVVPAKEQMKAEKKWDEQQNRMDKSSCRRHPLSQESEVLMK